MAQKPCFPSGFSGVDLQKMLTSFYPNWDQQRFANIYERFGVNPNQRIDQLSVGTAKLMALCTAYAISPIVYILDEPTAGLDLIARQILFEVITEESQKGCSTILSTHIVEDVVTTCTHLGVIH